MNISTHHHTHQRTSGVNLVSASITSHGNSSIIHNSHSMRPSLGDPNKIADIQLKHKELRRIRRENQMQQMQEQNKQENQEIISILYKKKRVIFAIKCQQRLQVALLMMCLPLSFQILISIVTFDIESFWTVIGCVFFLGALYIQKSGLFDPIKMHLNSLAADYKQDKMCILNGMVIKDKRDSSSQGGGLEEEFSFQIINSQDRQSMNQCELSDKSAVPGGGGITSAATAPQSLSNNQHESPKAHAFRRPFLKMLGGKSSTSRDLFNLPQMRLPQFTAQGQASRRIAISKIPEEQSFSVQQQMKETQQTSDILKIFQINNIVDLNGIIQITSLLFISKIGILQNVGENEIGQVTNPLKPLILPLFTIAVYFMANRTLLSYQAQVFVHLLFIIMFSDLSGFQLFTCNHASDNPSSNYDYAVSPPNYYMRFDFRFSIFECLISMWIFFYNLFSVICSFLIMNQEISKRYEVYRKKMEILFKANKYERIVQNVRNGYGILNQSVIHFCNEQFCQTLGAKTTAQAIHLLKQIYRKSRLQALQTQNTSNGNQSLHQLSEKNIANQRTVSVMEDILNFLKNRPSVEAEEDIEYQFERLDAKSNQKFIRFFQFSFQLIRWDGQQNILLSVKEITQDKKMLEQQLVNKLRNMMFKSFTHEIKTPLNGVIQSMDLTQSLLKDIVYKKKMRNQHSKEFDNILILMSQISSGVYILQNNLNDLIDYQQIETGNLKINTRPFNLKDCFDHILAIVKPQLSNPQVKLNAIFDSTLPKMMENDQDRLVRIVTNMLLNAQKFTQKGVIKFHIKCIPNKKLAKDGAEKKNGPPCYVRFEIADTGLGIPEEKLPYIFNLFESDLMAFHNMSQGNQQKSAKVGLPICQHLCQKMGGQIKVHAIKDKGSKFWFILPITPLGQKQQGADVSLGTGENSQLVGEGTLKNSRVTEAVASGHLEHSGHNRGHFDGHDESYESKDLELEDIYESDQEGAQQRGIPANLAMTSHQMNENIILSFFPAHAKDSQLGGLDEETKNIDFFDMTYKVSQNNRGSLGESQAQNGKFLVPTFQDQRLLLNQQLGEVKEESKEFQMTPRGLGVPNADTQNIESINQYANKASNVMSINDPAVIKRESDLRPSAASQFNNIFTKSSHNHKNSNEAKLTPRGQKRAVSEDHKEIPSRNWDSPKGNGTDSKQDRDLKVPSNVHYDLKTYQDKGQYIKGRLDGGGVRYDRTKSNFKLMKNTNINETYLKNSDFAEGGNSGISNNPTTKPNSKFGGFNSLAMSIDVCNCAQILIVDDIDMNRYILRQIFFSKFGIQSDEAINGREAVDIIRARAYQECCSSYKIIIMDFEMPIMNGIEASRKIKKYQSQGLVDKNTYIVAYTAYTDEESACKMAGMDYFLPKPASITAIQSVLQDIDDKLALLNEENTPLTMDQPGQTNENRLFTPLEDQSQSPRVGIEDSNNAPESKIPQHEEGDVNGLHHQTLFEGGLQQSFAPDQQKFKQEQSKIISDSEMFAQNHSASQQAYNKAKICSQGEQPYHQNMISGGGLITFFPGERF
ncbi:hypothetical protein FGO68_gene10164 [Halteria grandinella]|uniref:histidine kinase n=1 Tax=Halteria grandinella TaxID=5974 RepID=A0A8J8P2R0_HALGN|nr:hypothetical protein FGO68_gene10164 [Halteria grandinella]